MKANYIEQCCLQNQKVVETHFKCSLHVTLSEDHLMGSCMSDCLLSNYIVIITLDKTFATIILIALLQELPQAQPFFMTSVLCLLFL